MEHCKAYRVCKEPLAPLVFLEGSEVRDKKARLECRLLDRVGSLETLVLRDFKDQRAKKENEEYQVKDFQFGKIFQR